MCEERSRTKHGTPLSQAVTPPSGKGPEDRCCASTTTLLRVKLCTDHFIYLSFFCLSQGTLYPEKSLLKLIQYPLKMFTVKCSYDDYYEFLGQTHDLSSCGHSFSRAAFEILRPNSHSAFHPGTNTSLLQARHQRSDYQRGQ